RVRQATGTFCRAPASLFGVRQVRALWHQGFSPGGTNPSRGLKTPGYMLSDPTDQSELTDRRVLSCPSKHVAVVAAPCRPRRRPYRDERGRRLATDTTNPGSRRAEGSWGIHRSSRPFSRGPDGTSRLLQTHLQTRTRSHDFGPLPWTELRTRLLWRHSWLPERRWAAPRLSSRTARAKARGIGAHPSPADGRDRRRDLGHHHRT